MTRPNSACGNLTRIALSPFLSLRLVEKRAQKMLVFALQALKTTPPPASSIVPPLSLLGLEAIAATYLLITRQRGQAIKLPTTTAPTDRIPVLLEKDEEQEPDKFYPKLRRWKLATLAVNGFVLAVTLFRLGWEVTVLEHFGWRLAVERSAEIVFWVSSLCFPAIRRSLSIAR